MTDHLPMISTVTNLCELNEIISKGHILSQPNLYVDGPVIEQKINVYRAVEFFKKILEPL